jgi:hypothetical protein
LLDNDTSYSYTKNSSFFSWRERPVSNEEGERRALAEGTVRFSRPYAFFREERYWFLAALLFILMFARTLTGVWLGDFWEHAAVVRELAANPLFPRHPQLLVQAPHAFFSPYSLGLALISRLTSLSPITTLAIAGLANLVLMLLAFRWFIDLFFESDRSATAFYALLFVLLLWGRDPWFWSAFFHIYVLGFVLPYPSSFAFACMFASFGLYLSYLKSRMKGHYLLLVPVMSLVLITHPTTAIVMYITLFSLSLGFPGKSSLHNIAVLLAASAISFGLAAAWPYYSFIGLITGQSPDFHSQSKVLYQQVLMRTFPAAIGIPFLAVRLRKNIKDTLTLTFLGLTVVYCYGYLSDLWGYGRVISYMMIVLQLTLASFAARIESGWPARRVVKLSYAVMLALAVIFIFNLVTYKGDDYRKYSFLSRYTKQYDLVLSDVDTSLYVPVFGGKVIASSHPVYFVPDYAERKRDLKLFFAEGTTKDERTGIIRKYKPDYLLIKQALLERSPALRNSLSQLGTVIYSDRNFLLLSLKKIYGQPRFNGSGASVK